MTNTIGSNDGTRLATVTYLPGALPLNGAFPSNGSFPPPGSFPPAEAIAQSAEVDDQSAEAQPAAARLPGARLSPAELQRRMDEITMPVEPELPGETVGERSARAHNVSMHALTRKGMSSAEMTDLLRSRDLEAGDVANEVTRLEQVGLLNDGELAETLVRQLRERKGLGRSAVMSELRRRKVDPSAIEQALSDAYESDGDDELTRARAIAIKRAPQLRSLDAETARRRLGAFLMRKGYSGSVIASAVASALAPQSRSAEGPRFR
jgi:regulatory protein